MTRLRANFVGGTVDDSPLTSGATTLNSTELADLPTVASPDYAVIVLDPEAVHGDPEIVYVTAYTGGATPAASATISRGEEGTVAREHPAGTDWIHAPTAQDFANGLLAVTSYNPGSVVTVTDNGTTIDDIDATNLAITFTAPPAGQVLVKLSAVSWSGSGSIYNMWGLREGTTTIAEARLGTNTTGMRRELTLLVTGLTAGQSYTYKWAQRSLGATTSNTLYGGNAGPALMEVWAIPF